MLGVSPASRFPAWQGFIWEAQFATLLTAYGGNARCQVLQLFVTGCHRSGTSLLASLMHGLVTGQDPRQRRDDLELKLENPLGFFESKHLVDINDGLLRLLGSKWDRPPLLPASWDQPPLFDALQTQRSRLESYALDHDWVDKDPRLCITYPAYLHILLCRIPLVVALREPLAVATSLHARNGFSLNRGLVLWWIYNHHVASQLCSQDLLVPYRYLLNMDVKALQQLLGPFLELHKHQRPSDDHAGVLIASLLKPEFNRAENAINADSRARIHPMLLSICEQAFNNTVEANDQLSSFQEQFSHLPRIVLECSARDKLLPESEVNTLQSRLYTLESDIQNLASSLAQKEFDNDLLNKHLRDLMGSRSWKITAPLRFLGEFLHSLAR